MTNINEALTFPMPLSFPAHALAKRLSLQSNPQRSDRVYLNSLAIFAVDFYLQCMGMETEPEQSDSHDPIVLKLMDVADLDVKGLGKLECRPILGDATMLEIPIEAACAERIGYVAVRVNESRKQAEILGFIEHVPIAADDRDIVQIPIQELRSLAEFLKYLHQPQPSPLVNLRQWLEFIFELDWQSVEDSTLAVRGMSEMVFRSAPNSATLRQNSRGTSARTEKSVERGKLINLTSTQAVALIVTMTLQDEDRVILVEVCPIGGQTSLPENLYIRAIDDRGNVAMEEIASPDRDLQLAFSGELDEQFSIQIGLGEISVTENFMI
jgi:hypothetical protein